MNISLPSVWLEWMSTSAAILIQHVYAFQPGYIGDYSHHYTHMNKEWKEASGCPFLLSGLPAGSLTSSLFHASDHRSPTGLNSDHGVGYCSTATPLLMAYNRHVSHSI